MFISSCTRNMRKPHQTYDEGRDLREGMHEKHTETLKAPEMKTAGDCLL